MPQSITGGRVLPQVNIESCHIVGIEALVRWQHPGLGLQGTSARIRYTDHIVGDGERFLAELEKKRLEGMVAKRGDSFYVSGRTRAWLKIKTRAGREEMRKRSEAWQN